MSQMPKSLQVKLRKEGLDDQLNTIQRDGNNSNLQSLFIPKEKKFKYSITYSTTTPESAEEGDYSDTGFRIEPDVDELEHIIQTAVDLGISEHWISSSEVSDHHTGEETSYALHMDGISAKEKQFITYLLKTRQSGWEIEDFYPEFNDMDEAKYNYYKAEIYSKFGLNIDQNGDIIESIQPTMKTNQINLSSLSEGLRKEVKKHLKEGRTKMSMLPPKIQRLIKVESFLAENFYQGMNPQQAIQKATTDYSFATKQGNEGQADKIAGNLKAHLESQNYNWKSDPHALEILSDFV